MLLAARCICSLYFLPDLTATAFIAILAVGMFGFAILQFSGLGICNRCY